ncbi:MAG: hypothetical protein V1907_04865 [Candidatus Kerfeldbacteria bacterium]
MKGIRILFALALAALPLVTTLFPFIVTADSTPYIQNPISGCDDALCLFERFIRFFLGGVAVVSTMMFIWGGYLFLTSGGNAEQIKKGKDTLLWSSLGIVVILASWVILRYFIVNIVGSAKSG